MSSLTNVAKGLAAALSVQQVTEYANAWVTVSNKLVNSVRANEDLATVTQRVFDVSQNTRSSLEATATLYGRLERATRSAGTSTADLVKLTETINKGLAVSGATTEEASSTMTQLSQALASGVLRGEEFNSISENGSRLAQALAASLGVTIGQLRGMAAQGKLTTDVVVNGLLKQGDAIAKEFSNTTLTMGQSFTVATNNITKFVGEASSVNTTLNVFNHGVISLSENLDTVANVIGVVAVGALARFSGSLAQAMAARMADTAATVAQTKATAAAAAAQLEAATITARKAMLDRDAAFSAEAVALAEYNVAKGSAAEAFALENLIALRSVAIQRAATYAETELAVAAATTTSTAAAAAASTTIGGRLASAFALLGGPTGVIIIAAAAVFYFYQQMVQAREESIKFADSLDGVIGQMKTMSQIQLAATIDKAKQSIIDQKAAIEDLTTTLGNNADQQERLRRTLSWLKEGSDAYKYTAGQLAAAESERIQILADIETAQDKYLSTINKTSQVQAQFNGGVAAGTGVLLEQNLQLGVSDGLLRQFADALDVAGKAQDKFNASSLEVPRSAAGDKYLKELRDENELLAITDKRTRAIAEARQKAFADGVVDNSPQLKQIEDEAAKKFDSAKADAERTKAAKASTAEGKKAANQAESVAQKLASLKQQSELAGQSTQDLSKERAILTAQQSLGSAATKKDIAEAGEYAEKIWKTTAALKAQNAVPELKENASYDAQKAALDSLKGQTDANGQLLISQEQYSRESERIAQEHQSNLAKIKAGQVVTPQQEAAGTVDPVQALANEHAKKLELIKQFETQKGVLTANGLALMNAANTEYEHARIAAQWEIWKNQSAGNEILAASFESLAGNASNALTGIVTGSMTAEEAMSSLASNALNSLINGFVQMGVEWVKSAITGGAQQIAMQQAVAASSVAATGVTTAASTAAAGTTLAAWLPAALVASVGSFGAAAIVGGAALVGAFALSKTLAGGRKNGGPVSAGSMYQVGEGGMPEIYQSSSGRQYMIPGDNGSVISNKDMQSGSGGSSSGITVIIQNMSSNAGVQDYQMSKDQSGNDVLQIAIADINNGGALSQAISNNHQAPRRATQ
ncbi:tape measure protein [Rahnella inusitata]